MIDGDTRFPWVAPVTGFFGSSPAGGALPEYACKRDPPPHLLSRVPGPVFAEWPQAVRERRMTEGRQQPFQAEWIDQLRRFLKRTENVEEFGWAARMSISETVPGLRSTAPAAATTQSGRSSAKPTASSNPGSPTPAGNGTPPPASTSTAPAGTTPAPAGSSAKTRSASPPAMSTSAGMWGMGRRCGWIQVGWLGNSTRLHTSK